MNGCGRQGLPSPGSPVRQGRPQALSCAPWQNRTTRQQNLSRRKVERRAQTIRWCASSPSRTVCSSLSWTGCSRAKWGRHDEETQAQEVRRSAPAQGAHKGSAAAGGLMMDEILLLGPDERRTSRMKPMRLRKTGRHTLDYLDGTLRIDPDRKRLLSILACGVRL